MLREIHARIKQGYKTTSFPKKPPVLPERFKGCPEIDKEKVCAKGGIREDICPTGAISNEQGFTVDLARCIFCGACEGAELNGAVKFSNNYSMAAFNKEELLVKTDTKGIKTVRDKEKYHIFKKSLKLRQVSAGGCNACEADTNVLNTLTYNLERFGIQFVASPRHADGLLVTGPVTENMRVALEKTYDAVPDPKIVIAVGACALSGGIYRGHEETCNGVDTVLPVDLYIPGCPPHPYTILDGLLKIIGRVE